MKLSKTISFVAAATSLMANTVFAEGIAETHGSEINFHLNAISPNPSKDDVSFMPITDDKISQFLSEFSSEKNPEMSLQEMENRNLKSGELVNKPWSSNAWNDYYGSVSRPYSDPNFTDSLLFPSANWRYIKKRQNEVQQKLFTLTQAELDALSPAQKYDLFMGDTEFTFSRKVIDWVMHREEENLLALWSGICHGWSPSTGSYPRPAKKFTLKSPLGMNITFYPDDVKALEAFNFATMNYLKDENISVGKQCRVFRPKTSRDETRTAWEGKSGTDSNGRIQSPECFDVNPGIFHMATVNSINLGQHVFVMDRKNDKSVYNQPVFKYSYSYYNVYTRKKVGTLMEAYANLRTGLYKDPYKKYRSPRAFAAVGIEMTVWFTDETKPKARAFDLPEHDKVESVTTHYDLEIDESGIIVGGEWHHYLDPNHKDLLAYFGYSHPDTLWTAKKGREPESVAEGSPECVGRDKYDTVGPADFATPRYLECSRQAALNMHVMELWPVGKGYPEQNSMGKILDCVYKARQKNGLLGGATRAEVNALHDACALDFGVKKEDLKWLVVDDKPQPLGAVVRYLSKQAAL